MKKLLLIILSLLFLIGCANRGVGPQGGPKDETPPSVVKEMPENGALNYRGKTIEVAFNEYIQLDNVADNVLISPPQQRPPEVKAYGKKLRVTFEEELQDSTTYTIDFGAAICDNNEKNPLEGYSFSFATADVIDSLQISGQLLNSEDLNPISGIIVGIHANHHDSALATIPFTRITRTNSEGKFTIRNIRPGKYKLYALQDVSKDYIYQAGEGLALCDSLFEPMCHQEMVQDTLWKDSVEIDTIRTINKTFFDPQDVVLFFFKESKQRLYFQRAVRDKQHYFQLMFAAPQDSIPVIKPIETDEDWLKYTLCQANKTKDTITYWLTDSVAIKQDTLQFEMTYYKTDSLYELQQQTDTIRAIYRAPRLSERARAALEKNKKQPFVELTNNGKSPFEIYSPLQIYLATPIQSFYPDSLHLYQLKDTTHLPIKIKTITATDSTNMIYEIEHKWLPETTYELVVDSAAFIDIYGNVNNRVKSQFKVRSLDEYSSLIVKISPYRSNAVIQVLNENDAVVREQMAQPDGVKFEYLTPQGYYLRVYIDENNDGTWTTGDYLTWRHPEPVYYFPNKLTLRANWDFEETFEYLAQPQNKQKPEELKQDAGKKK